MIMSYDPAQEIKLCPVCDADANVTSLLSENLSAISGARVSCSYCGDFQILQATVNEVGCLPYTDPKMQALARHVIRKMQVAGAWPLLSAESFQQLGNRSLPTPAETVDNLLGWLAEQQDGRPGKEVEIGYSWPQIIASVGVIKPEDISWIVASLRMHNLINGTFGMSEAQCNLTPLGWQRFEELRRAQISSSFAFFARQFVNPELDAVFERCLRPAVEQTGYSLRTATQRAGLVDAVIEDEIRRCRFVIADLSDDNAGAYWEAGFAEGLRKPVIYICRANDGGAEKKTHFDTDHRQTVRWDIGALEETAKKLKAVIRNTLLGDAKQTD
jgi:hypothetical protein